MARKPRTIDNPDIDRSSPAWRVIITRFASLAEFCRLTGFASSTAYDWLLKGLIPADRQAHIKAVAIEAGIALARGDFEPEAAAA